MSHSIHPVKIEIYDGAEPVAVVEAFDEAAANVTISTVVNASTWPDVSNSILEALQSMKLEGDAK